MLSRRPAVRGRSGRAGGRQPAAATWPLIWQPIWDALNMLHKLQTSAGKRASKSSRPAWADMIAVLQSTLLAPHIVTWHPPHLSQEPADAHWHHA